jgi:hypothetical protein
MMFQSVEENEPDKRRITSGKIFIVLGVAALIAYVVVAKFITEDRCYANVVTRESNGSVEFTTKVVPCDCLAGAKDFWTVFHACPIKTIQVGK